jgi:asparagine synthase (glutamine-hydrolysing)
MCGINGMLRLGPVGTALPRQEMERNMQVMNDAIVHRGPDGEGVFANGDIAFGHRRLSILDLSENGAQPMFNEDGSVMVVFNGEIYNYLELIPDLLSRGHRFRSRSDTEVIIHAYEEYGTDCVNLFNGMWAFALYDFRRQLFFASRDRLGVKPFYFFLNPEQLLFSSEIKAILRIVNATGVNSGKIYDYLAYGYKTANGDTFFADIHELEPATNLLVRDGRVKFERYWDLRPSDTDFADWPDMEKLSEEFQALFADSIRVRFRSDVPVAILLSGGLDSTAITRTVDDLIERRILNCTEVKAFTAGFPGDRNDETAIVREFIGTCRHVQLEHVLPSGAQLPALMERIAYRLGEPVASATSFAHYSLMKEIHQQGFKVVINGQGSDEAFCGYDRYFMGYFLLDTLLSAPSNTFAQARAMHSTLGYPYAIIFSQFLKALLPRRMSSYLRSRYKEGVIRCLAPAFVSQNYRYLDNQSIELSAAKNLDRYLRDNIRQYGLPQILHYEDHSSMQHSIEMRSPFMDYRLVEFAFRAPMHAKYDMGITKRIVRRAFKDTLPSSVIENRRKVGFATPFCKWLSDDGLRSFADDVLGSSEFRARNIWDADKIRKMFQVPGANPGFPFWRILNLELWARAYRVAGI